MKIEKNNLSDSQVELLIKLGQEELSTAEHQALKELAPTVSAKGFRKGKVPLAVAKKNLDPADLANKASEIAINAALLEAFDKQKIHPLDQPKVDIVKFVPEQELEFKAMIETLPPVKLADYKKLKAKKDTAKVSAEEITAALTKIQQGFSEDKEVKRAAKNGDKVVIDFEGFIGDKAFDGGKANDYVLELGSNQFIPGFEEGIVGKKADQEFDLELAFPKDYHAKELKGKKVVFKTKLKKVQQVFLPEINDELAKKAGGFKTLKEFKSDIKKNLLVEKDHQATQKYHNDLVEELAKKSKMTIPEVLKQDQINAIKRELTQNLTYQGMTIEQYLKNINTTEEKWIKDEVEPAAISRVKAGLVLAELSKELKIDISKEEINQKLDDLKAQYANNAEALKQLESPMVARDLRNNLLTQRTIEQLAKINDK